MKKDRKFGANEDLPLGGQHTKPERSHGVARETEGESGASRAVDAVRTASMLAKDDGSRVADQSKNMDRDLSNDPKGFTEGKRRDGLRPEDLEKERENERDRRDRDENETL